MSQKERLRTHLDKGNSITRLQAFNTIGCFELSARIVELEKEGYPVAKERIKVTNRFGEKITVTQYSKG